MFYHPIRLGSGIVIYVPTSVQPTLFKYIDTSKMIQDQELDKFKRKVESKR